MTAAEKKQIEEISVELKRLYGLLMPIVRQRRKCFDKLPKGQKESDQGERAYFAWYELQAAADNVDAAIWSMNKSIRSTEE